MINPHSSLFMPVLALAFVAQSAVATTWWVATNGNDAAAGTEAEPFATLSNAFAHASSESCDVIRMKDGTYPSTGAIIVDKSVEIVGNDADRSKVVIDGETTKPLLGICHTGAFVHGITFMRGSGTATIPGVAHPSYFACNFEMSDGVLSNCTVTAGRSQFASCLILFGGAPRVVDCLIANGYNNDGGELACRGGNIKMVGSAEVIDCVITNGNAMKGGGIYMSGSTKLIGCLV